MISITIKITLKVRLFIGRSRGYQLKRRCTFPEERERERSTMVYLNSNFFERSLYRYHK
jgi:hypothetical protein